jgi:hypothetical protein
MHVCKLKNPDLGEPLWLCEKKDPYPLHKKINKKNPALSARKQEVKYHIFNKKLYLIGHRKGIGCCR